MQYFSAITIAFVVATVGVTLPASAQSRDAPIPHGTGQSVSPSFEGWYPNPDGSFTLSFGYFNRNFEQTLDIPIGTDNHFDPGPLDRGQPTHFLRRRQTGIFTVLVPADFGSEILTWSLTAGGETIAIPGHLRPEWQVDALHEITSDNHPPTVRFDRAAAGMQGPAGVHASMSASVGDPVTLRVWVTDDGVKKRPSAQPPVVGIAWSKFRGTGTVEFSESRPKVSEDGETTTTATFSETGDYIVRLLAWDDSGEQGTIMAGGFQCCWTNGYITVRVE